MSLDDPYQPLTVETVPAWLDAHPRLRAFVPGSPLHVREVGDGNLNLVFIVRDDPEQPGIVLKQSLPWVRVFGEGWPLTVERARHEADAYEAYRGFAGRTIPAYHGFDPTWYVIAMEDLADLRVWRGALNDGEIHAEAAGELGRFVARLAFHTSEAGLAPETKKHQAALAINPELCRITEDLVLSEPYTIHEHNWNHPGIDPLVAELRADPGVLLEVATLKHRFLTVGEALIHGDLHTGSVMVGGGRTVAMDPEFAFYGPVGYDLGALWANAAIAGVRAAVLDRPAAFREHVAGIVPESWTAFCDELRSLWPRRVDPFLSEAFLERWLRSIWTDAVGYAATKAIRRMVGFAHVTDIETLEEPVRTAAAGVVVRIARRFLLERPAIGDPAALWAVVSEGDLAGVGLAGGGAEWSAGRAGGRGGAAGGRAGRSAGFRVGSGGPLSGPNPTSRAGPGPCAPSRSAWRPLSWSDPARLAAQRPNLTPRRARARAWACGSVVSVVPFADRCATGTESPSAEGSALRLAARTGESVGYGR